VDVAYPLGGLYGATVRYGRGKTASPLWRRLATAARAADVAHRSFVAFERYQYLGARPPFVIAPSAFVQRHFAEDLGVGADQVRVLHCAIDPERFAATDRPARRDAARRAWGVGPSDVVALFVAMNYRLKGMDPLLRAVAVLPRRETFKLVVIGHPRTAPHQKLARKLKVSDRVIFAGFHADPRDAYFGADLLVHPTFYDPCSLVVLEAQACGLPVITSAHNGAAELLDVGTDGLVVKDPHDREELSAALVHYLDPARRQQAARTALRNSQRWTFEQHHRGLLALLREALRRKRAA
jgi:UDP-glucose:(heptosyl)LPS alpha-1,3-glucosyltransferase